MMAADRALQVGDGRRALDQRLFQLGYLGQRNLAQGHHYNGCGVGLVSGANCRCRQIAASIRANPGAPTPRQRGSKDITLGERSPVLSLIHNAQA
jgi:hypothetical protein